MTRLKALLLVIRLAPTFCFLHSRVSTPWRFGIHRATSPKTFSSGEKDLPWFEVGNAEDSVLSSYFSAVLEPGQRMALGGFRAVPEVAEMLVSGEIEDSDVDSVWAGAAGEQAVGSKAKAMLSVSPGGLLDADGVVVGADAEQFVKAWRALEAMFEYDNIDDEYKDRFGEDGDRMLGGAEAAANAKLEWTIVEDAESSAAAVEDAESSAAAVEDRESSAAESPAAAVKAVPTPLASEGSASADTSTAAPESVLSGACLSSWEVASNGRGTVGGTVLKNEVLACAFLAEPLADGDLTAAEVDELWSRHVGESEEAADEASFGKFWGAGGAAADGDLTAAEVDELWSRHVGESEEAADEASFGKFWGAIEDLFEDEGAEDEGLASTPKTTAPSSSSYEAIRSELVAIMEELPRAGLGCGEKTQRRMAELCDELDEHPTQVAMRATVTPGDLRLEGSWELAYTSSASFNFNQGFTGVAKTTPGGATFESLTQVLRATRIGGGGEGSLDLAVVGDTSFVETLSLGGQSGGANGEDSDGGLAQGPAGAAGFLGGIGAMFGGQDNKAENAFGSAEA
eukprot:CAMPEP_0171990782 /NCGR_PEP_ID=MMETSP0993-20121228/277097_1 /TAXON_ID=483369 /ORGANISM="non described non described, Strain CCMP2098" /LENGTH=569 /DNA_ID=CAMNT_0012643797 /DNA_START=14 /DNA_END=1720 /DNA_ORIENTATION=-